MTHSNFSFVISYLCLSCNSRLPYVDQIKTGFIAWADSVKGYVTPEEHGSPIFWESSSQHLFDKVTATLSQPEYFENLMVLWSQEATQRAGGPTDLALRPENGVWIKTIGNDFHWNQEFMTNVMLTAKMFEAAHLDNLLTAIDPLWKDADRHKQRAAAECLLGLLRGSKHWSKDNLEKLWGWLESRLDKIFAQLKPDTITFWDSMFHVSQFLSS